MDPVGLAAMDCDYAESAGGARGSTPSPTLPRSFGFAQDRLGGGVNESTLIVNLSSELRIRWEQCGKNFAPSGSVTCRGWQGRIVSPLGVEDD